MLEWVKNNIFNDVGKKIQNYAVITLIIDIVAVLVLAIIELFSGNFFAMFIYLLCGLGYALIFAMPIYAFGQLVEDVHQTNVNTTKTSVTDTDELPEL